MSYVLDEAEKLYLENIVLKNALEALKCNEIPPHEIREYVKEVLDKIYE